LKDIDLTSGGHGSRKHPDKTPTMRIALFSDIHANLPALQACLTDMDNRDLDAAYCLGDLVGYNVWPNEVVDEIRRRRIPTIAGNYDEGVGRKSDDCGCVYKTDDEKLMGKISISFTNHLVQPAQRHFLRTLPFSLSLEFRLADGPLTLVMVHGSPRHISEYLFEDRDERSLLRICKDARADILCFGHTHKPFHRILPREEPAHGYHRHAINTGSVGKPKDGDPRGCYVILTIDPGSSVRNPDSVKVEFVRFEYDIEKSARAIGESPLPNAYAEALRKGI
jgi:predicted phosphodiesterase